MPPKRIWHVIFFGVSCRFGGHGFASLVRLSLKDSERTALLVWALLVWQNIEQAIAILKI